MDFFEGDQAMAADRDDDDKLDERGVGRRGRRDDGEDEAESEAAGARRAGHQPQRVRAARDGDDLARPTSTATSTMRSAR